ncbi:MAG: DUF177 domain-containing protein [Deltaproteobacteria bacterium]|nr:MAG: DUF177 domain-containing protein [Deltaproteobacteria bacterium]
MLTVRLEEIPDEGFHLDWKEEPAALSSYLETLSRIDFDFKSSLDSVADITKVGSAVLIKGRVQTVLQLRCVRCLKEFSYPLSSNFDLTLVPLKETPFSEEAELNEEDLESGFFEEGEIRVSEIACEQVFLEIPLQPLCQEDCKGFCPVCGKDLNVANCDCKKEAFESGFAALRKLKLDS